MHLSSLRDAVSFPIEPYAEHFLLTVAATHSQVVGP
jgi:hypothetical protein